MNMDELIDAAQATLADGNPVQLAGFSTFLK
jgi:nucleoid DNA-binding protein